MAKISNIYQDKKSSLWYFVANLGTDSDGKRIRHWERGFRTQSEAKIAYDEYMNNYSKTSVKTNSTMTYGVFYETYYEPDYKNSVSLHTYENRAKTMKKHFTYFYNIKLKDISAPLIKRWQNELSNNYKSSYVRLVYGMFQKSLDLAVDLGLLQTNISRRIKNVKKIKSKIDFWTLEEFKLVSATFKLDDYYEHSYFIMIWLLFFTGMRFGESQALQWEDINFENETLDINKSMYYKNRNDFYYTPTKTKSSVRTISLDKITIQHLQTWKKLQNMNIKTNFVLSADGLPVNKHTPKRVIEKHSKLANVHRITTHALRHSHASLLIHLGENALIIRDRLGHASVDETLNTYSHLYSNANHKVADTLTNLLNQNM